MKESATKLINNSGLTRFASELVDSLMYSIRVRSKAVNEEELEIGASKIGGSPDLPSSIQWPHNNSGVPLSFIAQFNMAEVAPYDIEGILPKTGYLYFFFEADEQPWGFDPNDHGNWRAMHYDGKEPLYRTLAPSKLADEHRFLPRSVEFSNEITLPPWESIYIENLRLTDKETDLYLDLMEEVAELYGGDELVHKLLGYPDSIQGDMQLECQLVSNGLYCGDSTGYNDPRRRALEGDALNWRLLLQIDSEEDAGMIWGDVGRIYFWIQEDKLQAHDFSNVWLILQCY